MARLDPSVRQRTAAALQRARAALAHPVLERTRALLARIAAPAISLAVLVGALLELRALDWRAVAALVPDRPTFWAVFVVAYFVPVLGDWAIYRRIWGVPASGIAALARKMIGNDLLMGFVGEAYLFAWARGRGLGARAALGAVKDVSILSAAVGNGATILVAMAAAPFMGMLDLGLPRWAIIVSCAIVLAPPVVALALRGRLFSLPSADLRAITGFHAVRATLTVGLTALLWHLALPGIALKWWLVFSAVKLIASRLPLVSNKDLVFAGITVALLGRHADVPALMTMMATLTVAMHVLVGVTLGLAGAIEGALPAISRGMTRRASLQA